MNEAEATLKAQSPIAVPAGAKATVYEIPFESAEAAKGLVGKTITGPNGKSFEVVKWVNQSYVIKSGDSYHSTPVMYILSNIKKTKVS